MRIPAHDIKQSADFYQAAFGWKVGGNPDHPSFEDGTGHVIGHWMTDLPVAGEAGVLPYIYVDDIDATLAKITAHGGELATPPYPEGDLWVATFRDPAGNHIGIWKRGPRGTGMPMRTFAVGHGTFHATAEDMLRTSTRLVLRTMRINGGAACRSAGDDLSQRG
jgi:predicted enzyme related to lactoylglutathione lyase